MHRRINTYTMQSALAQFHKEMEVIDYHTSNSRWIDITNYKISKQKLFLISSCIGTCESPEHVTMSSRRKEPGPRFNIKISSYQYRKSYFGDKTILRPFYLHNGFSYTGKTTSLYWIGPCASSTRAIIPEYSGFPTRTTLRITNTISTRCAVPG